MDLVAQKDKVKMIHWNGKNMTLEMTWYLEIISISK